MTTLEATIGVKPVNFWSYVVKLMRLRWVILINGFKRAKPLRKYLTLISGLLIVGTFAGFFVLTGSVLRLLNSPLLSESGINISAFLEAIPSLIVTGAFVGILVTSFMALLQALYLANDMDFLLVAPIPVRAVFLTKLLDAILPNLALVLLLGLPVLFSLGAAGRYNILYFPLVLVVLAILALTAAGVSSLLVMAVVRFIPARKVGEFMVFVGGIIVFIGSQLIGLNALDFATMTPEQISNSSGFLTILNSTWSPLAWGGRALVDLGEGRWTSGIFFLVLTLVLFGSVFVLALTAAERLYHTGWATLQVGTQQRKARHAIERSERSGARASTFLNLLPPPVRAIMQKDFRMLRRDLRHMTQVVMPLFIGIAFAFLVLNSEGEVLFGKGEAPDWYMELMRSVLVYWGMVISLMVGWALTSRLALTSFSMEGKNYWMIKTSPVSASKMLAAKFLIAYLPSLILGWLFLLVIALVQKVPFAIILYGFSSVALFLAGLGGINLALGVLGANFNWTDPRRMTGMPSGYLGTAISLTYLLASVLLFFVAPVGFPILGIASEFTGQLIGLLAGGTVALLCTILPLVLVKQRVYGIGEE